MRPLPLLAIVSLVVASFAPRADALAFYSTVLTPGKGFDRTAVKKQYGWPKGAVEMFNDGARHFVWQFFFSECPNDAVGAGYLLHSTDQANDLLRKAARIQSERTVVVLTVQPLEACPVAKDTPCHATFRLGSPVIFDAWYDRLGIKEVDGKKVRVWGVHEYEKKPLVSPPYLSIHVDGERVRPDKLKLPPRLTVGLLTPKDEAARNDPAYLALKKLVDAHQARLKALKQKEQAETEGEGAKQTR